MKTVKWDYTTDSTADTTKPTTTAYVEEQIGLLTNYECMMIGVGADSYINNNAIWWTMTLSHNQQGSGWYGWYMSSSGTLNGNTVLYATDVGWRPSVVLVPGILISDVDGDGNKEEYIEEPRRVTTFFVALTDGTHGIVDDNTLTSDELKRGNVIMSAYDTTKAVMTDKTDGSGLCSWDETNNKWECGTFVGGFTDALTNMKATCVES